MVGRDAELASCSRPSSRVRARAPLGAVTVVADAGMGKSRLLYEFQNWAETRPERFQLFRGRAHPQTQGQPYGLLRDILARRLQIADSDSMEAARRKIEQGVARLFEHDDGAAMAQAHAHLLGHLIGLDFSRQRHIRGILDDGNRFATAASTRPRRCSGALARTRRRCPSCCCSTICTGPTTARWTSSHYLAQANRDVPMLVLGLTRPALFERRPDWSAGRRRAAHRPAAARQGRAAACSPTSC